MTPRTPSTPARALLDEHDFHPMTSSMDTEYSPTPTAVGSNLYAVTPTKQGHKRASGSSGTGTEEALEADGIRRSKRLRSGAEREQDGVGGGAGGGGGGRAECPRKGDRRRRRRGRKDAAAITVGGHVLMLGTPGDPPVLQDEDDEDEEEIGSDSGTDGQEAGFQCQGKKRKIKHTSWGINGVPLPPTLRATQILTKLLLVTTSREHLAALGSLIHKLVYGAPPLSPQSWTDCTLGVINSCCEALEQSSILTDYYLMLSLMQLTVHIDW